MSGYVNVVKGAAWWIHQSVVELPVAGNTYTSLIENIAKPGWEVAVRIKNNIGIPTMETVKPYAYKYRYGLGCLGVIMAYFFIKPSFEE